MTTTRPLTPLERAILRAVVELGQETHSDAIRKHVHSGGKYITSTNLHNHLNRLVNAEYLTCSKLTRKFWRPAFDFTEVLREP